jgi:hypothetical protein
MGPLNRLIFYLLLDWWFIGISICLRAQAIAGTTNEDANESMSMDAMTCVVAAKLYDMLDCSKDNLSPAWHD